MKQVKDLALRFQNREAFKDQLAQYSDKNIFWIAPQLTGRQLYRSLLPYFKIDDERVCTAISEIGKHSPQEQLAEVHASLDSSPFIWADVGVIPFTVQPLLELYQQIRSINEKVKIVYSVDFNFYLMYPSHPYAHLFNSKIAQSAIEDNMFFADNVLVSNKRLDDELTKKMVALGKEKYSLPPRVKVGCQPLLIDSSIVTSNLGHEELPLEPKNGKFRIGVVATSVYADDIKSFADTFKEINKKFKDKVQLVFYGFDGKYNNKNTLEGVDFEFHKPTSIIHYFKKLESLNLDLLFIPLKDSMYNNTSENYNKWLEAGLFKVPVMVNANIYPYSALIKHEYNGFQFKKKGDIIKIIEDMLKNSKKVTLAGETAYLQVTNDFAFNESNVERLKAILL